MEKQFESKKANLLKYAEKQGDQKSINNEPEDQKMLRTKLALEKLKTEFEIFHSRSQQYQQKYENIDINIVKQIEKTGNYPVQNKLKEVWYEERSWKQEKSHNIWQKKEWN